MATLFESLGHSTWVNLREHIGAPVSAEIAEAKPLCPLEKVKRRAELAALRAEAERDLEARVEAQATKRLVNIARMHQVAGAPASLARRSRAANA